MAPFESPGRPARETSEGDDSQHNHPHRQLRFTVRDEQGTPAADQQTPPRPERWASRHDRMSSMSSSDSWNSRMHRRRTHLKKQGSLFATADEDLVNEKKKKRNYLIYKLESWLSNRNLQYLALLLLGLWLILMWGVLWMLVQDKPADPEDYPHGPFFEGIWIAWTFMADPGTHAYVVDPRQRAVGSFIALSGIIFFACLLGIVVDAIRNKMELLRQGRSRVVEANHSLILGWTEKTILLIEELCVANHSEGGGVIVVMAKQAKQDMEQELRLQLPKKHLLGTKVVFRQGSPLLTHDLIKVGGHRARSIIILSDDNDPNQADAETLRTILVLRTLPYGLKGFIVAEVRDISNEPLLKMVGGSVTETVPSHDILGRLMLMAGRSPGLAKVYESLLGFQGDEFYMWEWPQITGLSFGDLIGRFPDAIPIGIKSSSGTITLNPEHDVVIRKGDKLIVIAEDDDTYRPEKPVRVEEGEPPKYEEPEPKPETILVAGWRRDISDIFVYLDNLVIKGTELHMMTHCVSLFERTARLEDEGLDVNLLENLKIVHHFGNTTVRRKIEALNLESFNSVMIFADQAFELDTMHADSHSLATLLLIRDQQMLEQDLLDADELVTKCPIVCEILDPRTQKTISGSIDVQHSSEFCHSNLMIAQIMAMVSENRTVKDLLDEMLGEKGCNVAVFPAQRYAHPHEQVSFWSLCKRAIKDHAVLIGYNIKSSVGKPFINPRDKATLKTWDGADLVALMPSKNKKLRSRASMFPIKRRSSTGSQTPGSQTPGTARGAHMDGISENNSDCGLSKVVNVDSSNRMSRTASDLDAPEEPNLCLPDVCQLHVMAGLCHQDTPRASLLPRVAQQAACTSPRPHQEDLEGKVLRLIESMAELEPAERQRLGKVLDNVSDIIASLPARTGVDASSKKKQPAEDSGGNAAEWWNKTWLLSGRLGQCVSDVEPTIVESCDIGTRQ